MPYKPHPRQETLTFTDDLKALVKRADQGDTQAVAELQRLLNDNQSIWQELGDLARHAEQAQINVAAGDNTLLAESIRHKADSLRRELTALTDSPLERLLIDRVVISWIQLHAAELQVGKPDSSNADWMKYLEKRHDQAHRRYLGAIRELSRLQKLLRPEPSAGTLPAEPHTINSIA